MSTLTSRLGLTKPAGGDGVDELRLAIAANADLLDTAVEYDAGPLASRPTSTLGTPGRAGRVYQVTDDATNPNRLDLDLGTSWRTLNPTGLPLIQAVWSQTIPGSLNTNLNALTKEFDVVPDVTGDTAGGLATIASTTHLTIVRAGLYRVSLSAEIDNPAPGIHWQTRLQRVSGATTVVAQVAADTAFGANFDSGSVGPSLLRLTAGDYFYVDAFHNAGTNLTILGRALLERVGA